MRGVCEAGGRRKVSWRASGAHVSAGVGGRAPTEEITAGAWIAAVAEKLLRSHGLFQDFQKIR